MPQIASIVFFDIETTGLPLQEKNQTKIIEFSLVAVLRKDLEITPYGQTPPIVSKLTSLLNPEKTVCRVVTKMTGLSRKKLAKAPTFKDKAENITSFLNALPSPVCLLAHNGNSFDFRILLAEYNDISASLPANLYCVDSLIGFRSILMGTGINYLNLDPSISDSNSILNSKQSEMASCEEIQKIVSGLETNPGQGIIIHGICPVPVDNTSANEGESLLMISAEEEAICEIEIDSSLISEAENCEPNTSNTEVTSNDKKRSIDSNDGSNKKKRFDENADRECFKLTSIYKRLCNKDEQNAHRAEGDCMMLLECVVALKQQFLPWADKNCQLLTKIKPIKRVWYSRWYNRRY